MGISMPRDVTSSEGEMTRRTVIGTAAAATAASSFSARPARSAEATGCQIGPPPHEKGPLVFMDYDQVELDAAYSQAAYAPMGSRIQARRATNSAEVRRRLGEPQRVSYGPTEVEKLDIFRTDRPNAPTLIFVHGGAWLGGSASEYHFAAEMMVNAGVNYVALDFIAVGPAKGDIRVMADQVRRGIVWVYKNAASFGADPDKLYLGGQSSGAHLSGVALVTQWEKDFGVPDNILKGGILLSGMYEMKPVRLSSRSNYVKFDDSMEDSMSTIRHLDRLRTPVTVMYGTFETPEFQRQSRDFAAAVKAAGKPVTLIVAPNHNHYEVQETLANPYGWAGRAALAMMGLGKA
jgi:arylformamidase